jgi:5,5'-dehydrodivanillate O-demethylase
MPSPRQGTAAKKDVSFHQTGPGTPAGRYLRSFWQPIFHSEELPVERVKPVKIMGSEYALYRGTDGEPHLIDPTCPHRGARMSVGLVEGSEIRCLYHGWKFDGMGRCTEQPAEPQSFCDKVSIKSYPCRDYIGLVFAYLGDGAPPAFPRYPNFEDFEGFLECDSYVRDCNYFNNLENGGDLTHSGFVHRNNPGSFDGLASSPIITAEESCWGITVSAQWPDRKQQSQIGMPNIFHHKAQPTDPTIAIFREFMAWWVPIDDDSHWQFTVAAVRLPSGKAAEYKERRKARLAKRVGPNRDFVKKILAGELYLDQIDPETVDWVRLQDDVAQAFRPPPSERLGQGDRAVILIRKIWQRELRTLLAGQPLTSWTYDTNELSISRGEEWEAMYGTQLGNGHPAEPQPA